MQQADPGLESIRSAKIPTPRGKSPEMVLTRQYIEATMLVLHRLSLLPTKSLMEMFLAGGSGMDLTIGRSDATWDVEGAYPDVRVRAHVLRLVIEWILDTRRMPWGPYQAGYGPDPRDAVLVGRGISDTGR